MGKSIPFHHGESHGPNGADPISDYAGRLVDDAARSFHAGG